MINSELKVTLVTTIKNEASTIEEYIRYLLNQTKRPDELIFVDGGSTDETLEIIERNRGKGISIRLLICKDSNIAQGRNFGIKDSSYDLIAVTDVGCRPERDWLKNLVAPFATDPKVDVVGGAILPDPHSFFEKCAGELTLKRPQDDEESYFLPFSRNIAFRKKAWEKVGGYPECYIVERIPCLVMQ